MSWMWNWWGPSDPSVQLMERLDSSMWEDGIVVLFHFYSFHLWLCWVTSCPLSPVLPATNHLPEDSPHQWALKGRTPGSTEVKMGNKWWFPFDYKLEHYTRVGVKVWQKTISRKAPNSTAYTKISQPFWTPSILRFIICVGLRPLKQHLDPNRTL